MAPYQAAWESRRSRRSRRRSSRRSRSRARWMRTRAEVRGSRGSETGEVSDSQQGESSVRLNQCTGVFFGHGTEATY